MRPAEADVLDVDPLGIQAVASGLRGRSEVVAAQRRVCDRVDLDNSQPTIGSALGAFISVWGSGLTALAYELDLLGVELGRSAEDVADVDRACAQ